MKRIHFILSLICTTIVFCLCQYCTDPREQVQDLTPEKYWKQQNEKELFALNQSYELKLSELFFKNDSLKSELDLTLRKLRGAKFQLHQSKSSVLNFAQKDTVNQTYLDRLSNCDSLKKEVVRFVAQVDSASSFYDSTIVHLQSLAELKDSSLIVCMRSYDHLKQIGEDNLRREERLTADLEEAIKVQKRKNLKNKFLTGGFLIVSGILTTILIRGK